MRQSDPRSIHNTGKCLETSHAYCLSSVSKIKNLQYIITFEALNSEDTSPPKKNNMPTPTATKMHPHPCTSMHV